MKLICQSVRQTRRRRHWRPALLTLAISLLIVPWFIDAVRIYRQGVRVATTPVATCLTELHIADGIRCVAEGRPLYPALHGLPAALHYYNSLTYLPSGIAGRWLDLEFDGLLILGRILPLACALGIAMLLGFYAWRRWHDWRVVALCSLMIFFYHSTTLTDFFRNRPETPALMLALAGWIVVQLRPRFWPYFAAVLFVAAVSFKQTFLAAPLACGVQLCLAREWKDLARLVGTSVATGFAMIAASWFWLGDGYFQHTVFAMQSNPIDPLAGARHFLPVLFYAHWGLLLPAALFSSFCLAATGRERPLLMYLGVCLALTCLAQGKVGADLNYHVELSTLMTLTVSAALGHLLSQRSSLIWAPVLMLLLGTWLPILERGATWNNVSLHRMRRSFVYKDPIPSQTTAYAKRFAKYRGRALITDDEIAIRIGEPVAYDWYAMQYFFASGYVDFEQFRRAIYKRQFDVIVLRADVVAVGRDGAPAHPWQRELRAAAAAAGYRVKSRNALLIELVAG